jgi:hypothetical protein
MTEPAARDTQIADAVAIIRGLLGDRDASKVEVEVTRGGTYRITAEAGEGAVDGRIAMRYI